MKEWDNLIQAEILRVKNLPGKDIAYWRRDAPDRKGRYWDNEPVTVLKGISDTRSKILYKKFGIIDLKSIKSSLLMDPHV